MAVRTEVQFQTDARPSGSWHYRGELWLVADEQWELIHVTKRQYRSVEDARDGARAYIDEFRRSGVKTPRVEK